MTTKTTSPTLHERLRDAAERGQQREGHGRGKPELWQMVPVSDIAAIEADMTAEATAPLLQEIERLKRSRDYWKGLFSDHVDAGCEADVILLRAQLDQFSTALGAQGAENAALRQAGDAMRQSGTDMKRSGRPCVYVGHVKAFVDARAAWDAATTPRAEETPMNCGHPCHTGNACVCAIAPSPTDAAGEGEEPLVGLAWVKSWIGTFGDGLRAHDRAIEALEQRADDARERLDTCTHRIDEARSNHSQIGDGIRADWAANQQRMDGLHRRIAALEARTTPQPVAVTPKVTEEMVEAFVLAQPGLTNMQWGSIRAGLTAALAAAKEAGK